ncbi:MAG: UDP-glucose/GDP-mannose dehydrogenase family protein [Hyphomicrobiales bacterium]|nr:UDP-glucose/GDP-mannose dehydrogenase family protein [Hyphomicrobiales bacterium]
MKDVASVNSQATELMNKIEERSAVAGVIGLGYVGLPLAVAMAKGGFRTVGFDIDPSKPTLLKSSRSYIGAVSDEKLHGLITSGRLDATTDFSLLAQCDVIAVCVPTPLTRNRDPDLSYVENTARTIAKYLRRGQLVVLESTTWPGTTEEILKPILEASGFQSGRDFFVGFSPEREDPGNLAFTTTSIPKVVAGDGADASLLMSALYAAVVDKIVIVSSPATAEAVKITENIFRAVNIALVNELKVIYDAMGIDVWEVIEAAKTKPFGYMPFYPGPGLGGHCIPIDPFYLTWKSREHGIATRFIELAGEINLSMPKFVIGKLEEALDRQQAVSLGSAHVLLIGLAYKKNVSDIRESPGFKLIELLEIRGTRVDYLDPHIPEVPPTREHAAMTGRRSVDSCLTTYTPYDAVIICTDHDALDYQIVFATARLIVDTRNVFGRLGLSGKHIVKA